MSTPDPGRARRGRRAPDAPPLQPPDPPASTAAPWARRLLYGLLLLAPVAVAAEWLHASPTVVFVLSCAAVLPLAALMGKATEAISEHLGDGIGGLLNATFGNAAELIIAFTAMRAGLDGVVKASITGSIIGNILFVLGLAVIAGGARRESQRFNAVAASASATMLLLAVAGLVAPAVYHTTVARDGSHLAGMSLGISVVLLLSYVASLVFSLKTHSHLYQGGGHGHVDPMAAAAAEEPGKAPLGRSIALLVGATVGIAIMAEMLVASVTEASHQLGLTETFVGVFVVAVIGNAAEHSTAVWMAAKNKMDLAVGIAVESSKQIALFVAPVLVLLSWVIRPEPMTLEFTALETLAVLLTVVVVKFTCDDGETNWLEGVQMLALYAVLGVAFFFTP